MSKSSSTASKRERERMKADKAAMKRERRDQRKNERLTSGTPPDVEGRAEALAGADRKEQAVLDVIGAGPPERIPTGPPAIQRAARTPRHALGVTGAARYNKGTGSDGRVGPCHRDNLGSISLRPSTLRLLVR